jgi:hypothetical protein
MPDLVTRLGAGAAHRLAGKIAEEIMINYFLGEIEKDEITSLVSKILAEEPTISRLDASSEVDFMSNARAAMLRPSSRKWFKATLIDRELADALTDGNDEPRILAVTVRDGGDVWHLECRTSDGQKYAIVMVDKPFEALADKIAEFLNKEANHA